MKYGIERKRTCSNNINNIRYKQEKIKGSTNTANGGCICRTLATIQS